MSEEIPEDNHKYRKIFVNKADLEKTQELAERSEGAYTASELLRFYLPDFIRKIEEGDYDPVLVLKKVGSQRKDDRVKFNFSPKGEFGWNEIYEAAQRVNEDNDIAEVNAVSEGNVSSWPFRRPCESFTIIRAALREIALQRQIFSEDVTYKAKDLRRKTGEEE
jgi:hypothetical protein